MNATMLTLNQSLTGLFGSSLSLGNLNDDNLTDLIVSGNTGVHYSLCIFTNKNITYLLNETIDGVWMGTIGLIDFNKDGNLELFINGIGYTSSDTILSKIYKKA